MPPRKAKPNASALIIVDMINLLDFPEGATLARRALPAAERIAALKRRFSAAGAPVIYANDNVGDWHADFSELVETCATGVGGKLVERLRPAADDYYVLKPRHSAFHDTPLPAVLARLQVSEVVICGIASDMCVLASALDARVHGYSVTVPADCVQAQSEDRQRTALKLMAKSFDIPTKLSRYVRIG